jgi:putative membrane protein
MYIAHLIVGWLLSALALWLVGRLMRGIQVDSFGVALVATFVLAVIDPTLGWFLRVLSFPLTVLTLGLFRFVIKAILLKLTAMVTPGFRIDGFLNALVGSLVLTVLDFVLRQLVRIH